MLYFNWKGSEKDFWAPFMPINSYIQRVFQTNKNGEWIPEISNYS